MKNKISYLSAAIIVLLSSCIEECGECFSPPTPFIFELVNEQAENLFATESYDPTQLKIVDTSNNENFEFKFITENERTLIEIGAIGGITEEITLSFQLEEREIFTFYVDAERRSDDCCSFTRYNQITIEGAKFEQNSQTKIYEVIVQ